MNEIVVTAVGADRPGIVAALTGALLEIGGNLEETRAALLRGSFATVLAVAVPDGTGVAEVEAALAPVAAELGLGLWVGPAAPKPAGSALAALRGLGLRRRPSGHRRTAWPWRSPSTRPTSSTCPPGWWASPPIYVLGIEIELPAGTSPDRLAAALAPVAEAHGVELTLEAESDEVM